MKSIIKEDIMSKKIICLLILICVIAIGMTGCTNNEADEPNIPDNNNQQVEENKKSTKIDEMAVYGSDC